MHHTISRLSLTLPCPQISKIAVAPAVLLMEWFLFAKTASAHVVAAIVFVCTGVGLATVSDFGIGTSSRGLAVGAAAVGATALYQVLCHPPIWTWLPHASCESTVGPAPYPMLT